MSVPGNPSDTPVLGLSSSPNNSESATVKRAPVTYGRRQHDAAEDGAGSKSCLITSDDYSSTCNSKCIKGQVKARLSQSEPECADDEREDEDEQCDTSPKFTFDWKKRLQELDNEDDIVLATFSGSKDNGVMLTDGAPSFKASSAEVEIDGISLKGIPFSLAPEGEPPLTDKLEVSSRHSPPSSPVNSRKFALSTPDKRHIRWRTSYHSIERVSDSESEPSRDKLGSSTNTSPPLIFQTPNTRSSPTPPTSDDEMPSRPTSKGKGDKGSIAPGSIPPLQFEDPSPGTRVSIDKRKSVKRMKAPTKMELAETAKDRARLTADQSVSIPKTDQSRKFTLHTFFADIGGAQEMEVKQPSDPILPFSSSPSRQEVELQVPKQTTSRGKIPELQMVSVEKDCTKVKLQAFKQHALALQSLQSSKVNVDDDDDLEIVADSPSAKSLLINTHKPKSRFRGARIAKHSSALLGSKGTTKKTVDKNKKALTQAELSRSLAERVKEQNAQAIKQKEDEWLKKGGRLKTYPIEENPDLLHTYVQKGLENSIQKSRASAENDETGRDGEEFSYDSGHPCDDEETMSKQIFDDNGATQVEDEPTDDEVGEAPRFRKKNRHTVAIIDSDSESERRDHDKVSPTREEVDTVFFGPSKLECMAATDESDENTIPLASSSSWVVHRGSVSSLDELAEDRSDKENNQKLAFDRSEDKENKVVVRHEISPFPGLRSVANSGNNIDNGTHLSPGSSTKEGVGEENNQRSPLTVLSEDKSRVLQPEPSWTDMFASRPGVLEAAFTSAEITSPQQEKHCSGIAQLEGAPSLQPAFSDLFDSGTMKADGSQRITSVACSPHQQRGDLGLTQDVLLQPAFDIGNQVLRKAESIFEKEQLFLLEEANKKAQKKQFYVNDFGFLTQTRPNDEDFELYKSPLVTQKTAHDALLCSSAKDSQRQPLSTLSLSISTVAVDNDDIADAPNRRLKRRMPSPIPTASIITPASPTPAPRQVRNAFDILRHKSPVQDEKTKNRQRESDLVVAEAEESDDDDVFGFGNKKKEDEEEEDEDLDRTLETLVDDRDMDANTLAAERVIEKFKEHAEHDDQELEKLHQAAVHGELRRKRRNRGIGLDDSDEESDEDERNRRIRRRMSKRQRIDRDNIKALADNEETKSFYKVYEHDLFDDDIDFGYLQRQDVVMNDPMNDSSNEEAVREYVTRDEIEQHVRDLARKKETKPNLDPRDISWIDDDKSDEEVNMRVKILCDSEKKGCVERRSILDEEAFEISSHSATGEGEAEKCRLRSWANTESKRFTGAGRSVGGVAVTGHGNSKKKASRTQEGTLPDDPVARRNGQRKPLKATPSMLAGVSDRRARFG